MSAGFDLDAGTGAQDARPVGHLGVFMTWAGALMSLALLVGMAVWGFQLAMRDISGVPVVHAVDGPMRVAPEDPGGQLAAHVGLSVNTVAAEGGTGDPADRLVLAPRTAALDDEDRPQSLLQLIAARGRPVPADTVGAVAGLAADDELTGLLGREDDVLPDADGDHGAVEQASLDDGAPTGDDPGSGTLDAETDADAEDGSTTAEPGEAAGAAQPAPPVARIAVIPASVPGVRRSPLPQARPDTDLAAEAVAANVARAVAGDGLSEVDAATIPAGTRLVQLGAFESAELARKEWAAAQERFAEYLYGKSRVIQEAASGGKTFFRLRVMGFTDISDARRFCAVLQARNANCIPVVTR